MGCTARAVALILLCGIVTQARPVAAAAAPCTSPWCALGGSGFQPRLGPIRTWQFQFDKRLGGFLDARFWDEAMLREGVALPSHKQLYTLLQRLHSGQPITVVAFGTSISHNGGCWHRDLDHLQARRRACPWLPLLRRSRQCQSIQASRSWRVRDVELA
jgi:hypothetical protein